ncbi:MAG TPA: SgcJ/EcaC family oxidoreductase [Chthoniobacterales bacterium]|nr:SgcJ/EcaC family oxidoreductase [Chthoniobacterales bacterium]
MKYKFTIIPLLFLTAFTPRSALSDSSEAETKAVRNVQTQQQDAWNRHDAKAYASLFAEDGDCVNVVGWWWKGRAEIEKKLTAAYAFVFSESVLTITDVEVRFPAPDVAVAHVRWTMTGARTPDNIPKPQQGIQTQLLQKQNGKWLIAAFQNTNSIPETPFPQGPPTNKSN